MATRERRREGQPRAASTVPALQNALCLWADGRRRTPTLLLADGRSTWLPAARAGPCTSASGRRLSGGRSRHPAHWAAGRGPAGDGACGPGRLRRAQSGPQPLSTGARPGLSARVGSTCSSVAVTVGAADVKPTGSAPAGSTLSLPGPSEHFPVSLPLPASLRSTSRRAPLGPARPWGASGSGSSRVPGPRGWETPSAGGTVWSRAPVLPPRPAEAEDGEGSSGSEPRLVYCVQTVCWAPGVP